MDRMLFGPSADEQSLCLIAMLLQRAGADDTTIREVIYSQRLRLQRKEALKQLAQVAPRQTPEWN